MRGLQNKSDAGHTGTDSRGRQGLTEEPKHQAWQSGEVKPHTRDGERELSRQSWEQTGWAGTFSLRLSDPHHRTVSIFGAREEAPLLLGGMRHPAHPPAAHRSVLWDWAFSQPDRGPTERVLTALQHWILAPQGELSTQVREGDRAQINTESSPSAGCHGRAGPALNL